MQHILMSSSAHQCCVSSGLIQENIGVLFYLQVSGHHFTRRAYSEIAYSAEYRLQTKWICSSLQQKLVTELRQNFLLFLLFFFFFFKKRIGWEQKQLITTVVLFFSSLFLAKELKCPNTIREAQGYVFHSCSVLHIHHHFRC